jgi:hypothetical protein
LFEHAESEYFLQNIPPMFITVFHKTQSAQSLNGWEYRTAQRTPIGVSAYRSA